MRHQQDLQKERKYVEVNIRRDQIERLAKELEFDKKNNPDGSLRLVTIVAELADDPLDMDNTSQIIEKNVPPSVPDLGNDFYEVLPIICSNLTVDGKVVAIKTVFGKLLAKEKVSLHSSAQSQPESKLVDIVLPEWEEIFHEIFGQFFENTKEHHYSMDEAIKCFIKEQISKAENRAYLKALSGIAEEKIIHSYMKVQGDGNSTDYCEGWNDGRIVTTENIIRLMNK